MNKRNSDIQADGRGFYGNFPIAIFTFDAFLV